MNDTTFYVYHSDGTEAAQTQFEPEVQTLIPGLDAEQGGDSDVVEINPFISPLIEGHNGVTSFPAVVAVRGGRPLAYVNAALASDLDPPTLLNPGGALAEDTLDDLEANDVSQQAIDQQAENEASLGRGEFERSLDALMSGDLLTPSLERALSINLIRNALGRAPTNAAKYSDESEIPLELFASDMDGMGEDGSGGDGVADSVVHADFPGDEGFLRKVSARTYEAVKSNLEASSAPTVTDDETSGYGIGSVWIDQVGGVDYVCSDPTAGAAVWLAHGAPGGGEANIGANVGAGAQIYRSKDGVALSLRSLTTPDDLLSAQVNGDAVELGVGDGLTLGKLANVDESVDDAEPFSSLVLVECPPGTKTWKAGSVGGSGASGEVNDCENVGGGVGQIRKEKIDNIIKLRSLVAGSGIDITQQADTITIVNAVNNVFGQAYVSNMNEDQESTTSPTWVQHNQITLQAPEDGTYRIEWSLLVNNTILIGDIRWRIQLNNSINLVDTDDQGFGASEAIDAGDEQRFPVSGYKDVFLTAGNHEIDYDFSQGGAGTAFVYYSALAAYRVL